MPVPAITKGCTELRFSYVQQPRCITFDSAKRDKALADLGLDFNDAVAVFDGLTAEVEDTHKDQGKERIICCGLLAGRLVVIGYTPRGKVRHFFSSRQGKRS